VTVLASDIAGQLGSVDPGESTKTSNLDKVLVSFGQMFPSSEKS
jgi:hypothetical protein